MERSKEILRKILRITPWNTWTSFWLAEMKHLTNPIYPQYDDA